MTFRPGPVVWIESRVAALRSLFAQGLTTAAIATRLDKTEDAVRGKLSALGLRRSAVTWAADRIELLKRRHAEGDSFRTIAAELGVTRNAVIGKAQRLGLVKRGPALTPRKPRSEPRMRIRKPPQKPVQLFIPVVAADAPVPLKIRLMDLAMGVCKWPVNEGGPYLFCGLPAVLDAEPCYCPYHWWLGHNRSRDHELAKGPGPQGAPNFGSLRA